MNPVSNLPAMGFVCVQAQSPMFKEYIDQVLKNAKAMAATLISKGYTLVSGEGASLYSRRTGTSTEGGTG